MLLQRTELLERRFEELRLSERETKRWQEP